MRKGVAVLIQSIGKTVMSLAGLVRRLVRRYPQAARLVLLLGLLVIFVLSPWYSLDQWQRIINKGYLNYGTRISLLAYFDDGASEIGVEYQLLQQFCEQNDLQLQVLVYPNNSEMFSALELGRIDVAGGHLTITEKRQQRFNFSRPFAHSSIKVVTWSKWKNIKSLADLKHAKGAIVADSSYQEFIQQQDIQFEHLSDDNQKNLFELIGMVSKKQLDFTLADSEIIEIYDKFFPNLLFPLQLTEPTGIAFALNRTDSHRLKQRLDLMLEKTQVDGRLQQFREQIIQQIPKLKTTQTIAFLTYLYTRWSNLRTLFKQTAAQHDFNFLLLAAISYQESHWNSKAVSPTGVRGLMMLTQRTAKEVGISDRNDPQQSLIGGIRYFKKLYAKFPERISPQDRIAFALASYNMGYRHLEDARILTQRNHKDPDLWTAVEPFLRQLNQPKIGKTLKWGVADGETAANYVNNIFTYWQMLRWKERKTAAATQIDEKNCHQRSCD